jgi:hypothetical protein
MFVINMFALLVTASPRGALKAREREKYCEISKGGKGVARYQRAETT